MCFLKKYKNAKVNINSLPNEIILEILSYLDLPHQRIIKNFTFKIWYIRDNSLLKFSETNKYFYYLANKPHLWKLVKKNL